MKQNLVIPATVCLVLLIIIALLVTAGCANSMPGQKDQVTIAREEQSGNPAAAITVVTGTTTAPISQKAPEPAPATGSSDGVILLDPVGDVYDGQEYLITGTTSLPAGTALLLQLMPDTGTAPNGTDRQAVGGRAGRYGMDNRRQRHSEPDTDTGQHGRTGTGEVGCPARRDERYLFGCTGRGPFRIRLFRPEAAPGSGLSVDPAARSPVKAGDACTLVPISAIAGSDAEGFTYQNATVFTAVSAGNYSSPFGKKDPGITIEQAKEFAKKAFPHYSSDRVEMEYSDGSGSIRGWNFELYKDDQKIVMGTLDADTGDLRDYFIPAYLSGEQQGDSHPAVTMDSARVTAENEIRQRNGDLPLKLVESRLDSPSPRPPGMEAAGNYVFLFRRIIQGVPCNSDGFTISVDSGTGNVVSYYKSWHTPENAVAAQSVPAISRDTAIAVIEREARACYPASADSFRIVSADLEWMDLYNPDMFTPSPGVIPLAWYVRFDDKTIREREFPVPEEGSVDAQNGTLLSMYYVHRH